MTNPIISTDRTSLSWGGRTADIRIDHHDDCPCGLRTVTTTWTTDATGVQTATRRVIRGQGGTPEFVEVEPEHRIEVTA